MKKILGVLLTCVMLINMSIMAMAEEENAAVAAENLIQNGGFEDTVTGWKEKVDGGKVENGGNTYTVLAQDADAKKNGDYGLSLYLKKQRSGSYYLATYLNDSITLEGGRFYVATAWVRAKTIKFEQTHDGSGFVDNTAEITEATKNYYVGFYAENSDARAVIDVIKPDYKKMIDIATYNGSGIWGSDGSGERYADLVLPQGTAADTWSEWVQIKNILYVEGEADINVKIGLSVGTNAPVALNIDDVSLTPLNVITGESFVKKANGDTAEEYTYTINSSSLCSDTMLTDEAAWTVEGDGLSIENGVLSVTSSASGVAEIKAIKPAFIVGEETYYDTVTKTVDIHDCVAASDKNYISGGDFEETGDLVTNSNGVGTGVTGSSVKALWPQHQAIEGYSTESYCGERSLHIKKTGTSAVSPYYGVYFQTTLDRGNLYKFSAWVKLADTATATKAVLRATTKTGDYSSGNDIKILSENSFDNLISAEKYDFASEAVEFSKTEWRKIEKTFYIANSESSATLTAYYGLAYSGGVLDYYIDEVVIEKVADINIVGSDKLTAPTEGSVTAEYSMNEESGLLTSDITLKEEYEGVTLENGVLTITPEITTGEIVLNVVKSDIVVAEKVIDVHNCVAAASENILTGGDFEETGEYIYLNPEDTESKIIQIEGNAVESIYARNAIIKGYTTESYCGNQALHIEQASNAVYYPISFKANLQKGDIYKFTAYVKLAENSTNSNANLLVTTNRSDHSSGNGVVILKDGTLNNVYGAGSPFETGYAGNHSAFSKSEWTKIERTIFVSGAAVSDEITVWMGLVHMGGVFDYYIDDVSLVKVGEAKIDGADFIDIADEKTENYTFVSDVTAEGAVISLKEAVAGVTYADGVLTVTSDASEGSVTLQAVIGDRVVATKEIALFKGDVFMNFADDGAGNVSVDVYVKDTKMVNGAEMILAKYSGKALESAQKVTAINSDKGDYNKISYNSELKSGNYKLMLWDGLNGMKPITDAKEFSVIAAE